MHSSVTGIDINDDHLTAVQIIKGFGGWELTACARIPMEGEKGLDQGLSTLSQSMKLAGGVCIVALSGAKIYFRNLDVPFKDKRKQREVLSFELEPNVPFPIDDLIVDFFTINRSDAPELLAFFAEKRVIIQLLDTLSAHGIDPEALCVRSLPMALWLINHSVSPKNGLLLDLGEKRTTLVLWEKMQVVLVRAFGHGNRTGSQDQRAEDFQPVLNTVRRTLHAFKAERKELEDPEKVFLAGRGATANGVSQIVTETLGIPVERVDLCSDERIRLNETIQSAWDPSLMDGALSLALGYYSAKGLGPNLRRDEFEIRKRSFYRSKIFRKIAVWIVIIAALWAVDMGVDTYFLKQRAAAVDSRIMALFKKTFPQINRIVDPVKQAQIEVNELKRVSTPVVGINGRALDLLLEISERLPESMDLEVSRLVIDPSSVRIRGDTDTYNTVDRVKQGLQKSSLFRTTTITSANLDRGKNRVLFEVKLER
ncbi:MAG: hypothetical protein K9N10_02070 [Deltaproteobacteria bacterium]|nr:hypothetical protein [Deltaproteobacteria bacterium]